jgi:hypothetical protein
MRIQRSEAEGMADGAHEVTEPAQAVAAAVAFTTTTASAGASVVTGGATDSDGKLFVVQKVVVHGRLLLFGEGMIRLVHGQQATIRTGLAQ